MALKPTTDTHRAEASGQFGRGYIGLDLTEPRPGWTAGAQPMGDGYRR